MILYKYLSRFEVLTSGMLRFTQPGSFNDPFEVTPHIDALVERSKITSFGETLFTGSNFEKSVSLTLVKTSAVSNLGCTDGFRSL